MSNHFSAASLKSPYEDPRLDIADLYMFQSPDRLDHTVLIVDVNPFRTDTLFNPDAVCRINVDNDGDSVADVSATIVFSLAKDGMQTGTAYRATGNQARQPESAGEVIFQSVPVGLEVRPDR